VSENDTGCIGIHIENSFTWIKIPSFISVIIPEQVLSCNLAIIICILNYCILFWWHCICHWFF
jgi:hypothetical protein